MTRQASKSDTVEPVTPLQHEVKERFGVLPNFFRLAPESPEITANLWGFARFAYLDNPLPALFKERLFVYLSRFCEVRYCIVRHLGFLTGLGRPSGDSECGVQTVEEVLSLLRSRLPREATLEAEVARCIALAAPLAELPAPDSEMEKALFACAAHAFLQTSEAPRCLAALKIALGEVRFQHLMVFLSFIQTAHYWTKTHPELVLEEDIQHLLATNEPLTEYLLNDPEAGACQLSQRLIDELATLREGQRREAELSQTLKTARASQEALRRSNAELRQASAELEDARRAALNLMEDVVESREALRESEERFRMIADNMAQLAWTCDSLGNVTWYNQRWLDYTGMSFEELRGWDWSKVQHPDHLERVVQHLKRSAEIGELWEDTFPLRRKDGEYRWFLSRAVPIRDAAEQIMCWFGTNTDITERKEVEVEREQLLAREQQARALAEAANRAKDEWLAMVSHELRTPLNAMLGYARLLSARPGELPPNLLEIINTIKRNGERQNELINDLLDVARLMTGKLRLEIGQINLRLIIDDALSMLRPAADARQITLSTEITGDGQIKGDAARLQQVIANLLTNAIKFTPPGGRVTITLKQTETEAQLAVRDTGQGITPDFLPHVFERFSQNDASRSRRHGGLGLGLSLVKHLVELHGGVIAAASAGANQGATFTITLPLQNTLSKNLPEQEKEHQETDGFALADFSRPSLSGLRVLLVDDDADALALLTAVITKAGAEVQQATNAAAALARWPEQRPDALLFDIGLPDVDGYELLRQWRALEASVGRPPSPALALTAYASGSERVRALSAGYQMHLTKPVEPEELVAVIASLTRRLGAGINA